MSDLARGTIFDAAPALLRTPVQRAQAPALADTMMHVMLYITIVSSFLVVIEPAPYEYLAVVLGFCCVLARVTFSRIVLPLLILLLIRDAGGAIGLFQILDSGWMRTAGSPTPLVADFDYPDSIRFLATSFYLGLTSVMFACMFAQDTTRRTATLRAAYIMSAVVASFLGTLGYFHDYVKFIPNLEIFSLYDRATGGFKGPNDLGAFLIPPLMWLIEGFIVDRVRLRNLLAALMILTGLLLAFSRGAWGSSLFSIVLLMYLLFVTQKNQRVRGRLVFFIAAGTIAAISIFALLNSIDTVSQMFEQRTHLQAYDVNGDNRSRLLLQEDSLSEVFDHPLGMGPWGFAHATNWVSHNVYLGTLLNHGWIGGAAYFTLVVLTLAIGFRTLWIRTPWQTFFIASYVGFLALVFEGFWGDTDHWRHFYIMLGLVWGLVAATRNTAWQDAPEPSLNRAVGQT